MAPGVIALRFGMYAKEAAGLNEEAGPAQRRYRRRWRLARALKPRGVGRAGWRATVVLYRAVDRFLAEDGLYMASALAFTLVLAIFPFILLLTAVAGFIGDRQLATFLATTMFNVLPPQVANALEPEIWNVLIRDRGGGIVLFSLVIILGSVTSAVETIRGGLNRAYNTRETRSILRTAPESVLFVVLATIALLIVAFMAVIFPVAYSFIEAHLPNVPETFDLLEAIREVVVTAVLAFMLWGFHRWLPAHGRDRPALWPGILCTLVLWYMAGMGFNWYMSGFADYSRYYAGLAGIVAALLFFYISAVILLFAGALNRTIHAERRRLWAARASSEEQTESEPT